MNNNTEKTIRVAIYARVANGEQIDMDRKIRVCSEYIEHIPNHTIVAKYTDLNKSGRNISDRSGFQQMLFDAKNGMFDLIVVCELNDFPEMYQMSFIVCMTLKEWELLFILLAIIFALITLMMSFVC